MADETKVTSTEGTESKTESGADNKEVKTYSQEEVDKLLQSETDRRVTQALKKQEEKNASKIKEAEKLARMNADEKYEYELNQRELAIEAKEKELALAENKNAASAILADKGISLKLVDFVVDTDAYVMSDRIKLLENEFKKSVKAEVEKRLGSSAPKKSAIEPETMTLEKARQITDVNELAQIKAENPELWSQIKESLN